MSLDVNRGKGAAVLHGIEAAQALGFTHVLTMDADGQHPARLRRPLHGGLEETAGGSDPR